ncbi:acetolactate synthase large subunit [Sedimentitalea sp. JM2-8]|uniref:Acetolactate synthase large subunit n=1 Tax=Sedimentitalea xiamensis TaxID=3050037 RepID=A0ABT7FJB2_9RHOB|nr:acetolactate synthase large subunit [Sedimentitalea xiamensis]MDK3075232.1 acetolactate synthase large subunit [Sedimentitalea xiamensis]
MTDQDTRAGTMNGAESLVRTLLASGVDTCFSNPGTSEMHFVAALDHVPGMRSVLALFEGVATGAADGYFRMARKPACTLLHLGPGLANGLANLHNAKKAGSGIVNIVGEHAASHIELDAPLTADIAGIAAPMSHWVHTSESAADVGGDGARAVQAAMTPPGRIATLILPSDTAWNEDGVVAAPVPAPGRAPFDQKAVGKAVAALDGADSLLLLGGAALTEENLQTAGRIAAATGCGLLSEWSNARLERGAGRVFIGKVPYPIDQAVAALEGFRRIVLVGARAPIGFFAYPGKPAVLTRDRAEIIALAGAGDDLTGALDALADGTGARSVAPSGLAAPQDTARPNGAITPETIAAVLARSIPENAIVVDESVTTGRTFLPATAGAAPHSWLNNCGGSIGFGLPVAVGAATACPDRKVLALIGDGSAMYTLQAIWTMAREQQDVTMVIFANRSYAILRGELTNVGVQNPGPRAVDMLSLNRPDLGWIEMARGMGVEGQRVEDAAALEEAILAGLDVDGPYLIEAMM